jgi:hypothetical protein
MSENMSNKYEDIMFPVIYGMTYDQALKKGIIEVEEPIEEEPIEEEPKEEEVPEEES